MLVTLKNNTFTAQIDSLGAQLISLKDNNREYIWQREPAHWQSCSPLLFPVVGNCRNGKTIWEGKSYEIPKHGFCRNAEFSFIQADESHVIFSLSDSEDTHRMYPYAFKLSLTYALQEDGIFMDYQVENTDTKIIHYHLGAHPGFICPMEYGESFCDYVLEFEKEETTSSMVYDIPHLQFDVNMRKPLLNQSRILPLSYELFEEDAIFFDEIQSRKVTIKNLSTGKGVEVDYRDFETVAFWTSMPSRGPFLCVEPWNGSAIRSDEDDIFTNRHFLQSLEPGGTKKYHLGIRVLGI